MKQTNCLQRLIYAMFSNFPQKLRKKLQKKSKRKKKFSKYLIISEKKFLKKV